MFSLRCSFSRLLKTTTGCTNLTFRFSLNHTGSNICMHLPKGYLSGTEGSIRPIDFSLVIMTDVSPFCCLFGCSGTTELSPGLKPAVNWKQVDDNIDTFKHNTSAAAHVDKLNSCWRKVLWPNETMVGLFVLEDKRYG